MIPIKIDNTKRSMFRQCKMKYFLSVVNGLQSNFGSTAIRYGVCWHGIQEGFHSWVRDNGWPKTAEELMAAVNQGLILGKEKYDKETEGKTFNDDYKNFNTAVDAFNAYLDYFAQDKDYLTVISTEKKFELEIIPENQIEEDMLKTLPPIFFNGKIDLCVLMDSMKWIFDFKTTGWILDQVISRANRSPQLIGYSYAGDKVLDFKPSGCLCSFSQIGSTKSRTTGEWGKVRFDFRRVPQVYTEGDLIAWKLALIDTCREIYYCMKTGVWPESFDSCYMYGPCAYLKLCNQHTTFDNLNLDNYHQEFWDVMEGDE
ncbi:MAG: PD-(D/E)XK nuclease family protein [Candidatus Izemoplasmatales bacterium]